MRQTSFLSGLIQPLLISLYPALFLFAHNLSEVRLIELIPVLGVLLVIPIVLTGVCSAVYRDYAKGSLVSSLVLLIFFYFMPFAQALCNYHIVGIKLLRIRYLLFMVVFLLVLFCIHLLKIRRKHYFFARAFIVPFTGLIIYSLVSIAYQKYVFSQKIHELSKRYPVFVVKKIISKEVDRTRLPNIYYIILDRYASHHTLLEHYNYDNRPFLSELKKRGFYIAERSNSNYPCTAFSLPSSLNMTYLPTLRSYDRGVLGSYGQFLVQHNVVAQFLKSMGYRYVLISSACGSPNTKKSSLADRTYASFASEFSSFAAEIFFKTLLQPLVVKLRNVTHRRIIRYQFQALKDMALKKGPNFVFAHILCPHEPYVFDQNGHAVSLPYGAYSLITEEEHKRLFTHQITFINKEILSIIDEILVHESKQPIIVLQADHGGFEHKRWLRCHMTGEEEKIPMQFRRYMFGILNAYYLPGDGRTLLYETISPVNSFRVIFNHYFNGNFPLLEDKSYLGPTKLGEFFDAFV